MAKKYNQVIKVAKQKAYSDASKALLVLAMMNKVVDFSPVLKPNGTAGSLSSSAQYMVQIPKRIKSAVVANATAGTTASALAALDQFSKADWETIEIATGILRGIGVKIGINEEYDADSMTSIQAANAASIVDNVAITRLENLLNLILDDSTLKAAATALSTSDPFTQLSDAADEIMLKVTDIKHMSDKPVILMHPTVRTIVAKQMGTTFQQEVPIYQTGLKAKFNINGIPVIVDPNLNKYDATQTNGTQRYGAVIIDADSIAMKKKSETKEVDIDLGIERFKGKYFYDIQAFIDKTRCKLFYFDASVSGKAITKSAKVND